MVFTFLLRVMLYVAVYIVSGGKNLPTSQAGRTIISSWWIFCIIAIAVYSGNLTATLAISKQKLSFTTVAEMVEQTEYKWGTLGNSVYETIFKVLYTTNKKTGSGATSREGTVPEHLSSPPVVLVLLNL